MSQEHLELAPTQRVALDEVLGLARAGKSVVLQGGSGNGKTVILRAAHAQLGGAWIDAPDLQAAIGTKHPLSLEDALYELIDRTLDAHAVVFVDDSDFLLRVLEGCHTYPRAGLASLVMRALAKRASVAGKTLIFGVSNLSESLARVGRVVAMREFTVDDYRALFAVGLPAEQLGTLDVAKVFRFVKHLSASTLVRAAKAVASTLAANPGTDATDAVIHYLRTAQLVSNVDLGEVQTVKLEDLKGLDDVLRALEANVILPLEHSELASELSLKSKRGVLLAGPPGTGKTTIGRALAHRLRGKFFLVDGTLIAGTNAFYGQLHAIFQAAMQNAPAVVFIDDSDVIFEGQDPGLYRYLLTMLDGLESESAGGVCLIMTAMDVGSLPPALVRSGRIELWLETRLPDAAARRALLTDLTAKLPSSIGTIDLDALVSATEELSGADLKRVVEDGKLLYAFDRAKGESRDAPTDYFVEAIATVRGNKVKYAEAEARARHPSLPAHFAMGGGPRRTLGVAQRMESVTFVAKGG